MRRIIAAVLGFVASAVCGLAMAQDQGIAPPIAGLPTDTDAQLVACQLILSIAIDDAEAGKSGQHSLDDLNETLRNTVALAPPPEERDQEARLQFLISEEALPPQQRQARLAQCIYDYR